MLYHGQSSYFFCANVMNIIFYSLWEKSNYLFLRRTKDSENSGYWTNSKTEMYNWCWFKDSTKHLANSSSSSICFWAISSPSISSRSRSLSSLNSRLKTLKIKPCVKLSNDILTSKISQLCLSLPAEHIYSCNTWDWASKPWYTLEYLTDPRLGFVPS